MVQKSDRLVTVFGGGGFIGRYVVQALHRGGVRVRVAQRDPRQAWFLKPLGGLGQTQFIAADVADPVSVAAAVAGCDAAINLVGILKGDFRAIHVDGARHVAEAARAAGASALVQISAIGADPAAPSRYARSKGEGEAAVRAGFSAATIIRPSIVFGPEDDFVNKFARMARRMPVLPVLRGAVRFQPVFAADLGRAIAAAALDPLRHVGKTYALGGPQVLTMRELNEAIAIAIGRPDKPIIEIPDAIGERMAKLGGWLPGAPITWDQWLMLQSDNVVPTGAEGFEAFDITPIPLAAVTDTWLTAYRRQGRFAGKSPY